MINQILKAFNDEQFMNIICKSVEKKMVKLDSSVVVRNIRGTYTIGSERYKELEYTYDFTFGKYIPSDHRYSNFIESHLGKDSMICKNIFEIRDARAIDIISELMDDPNVNMMEVWCMIEIIYQFGRFFGNTPIYMYLKSLKDHYNYLERFRDITNEIIEINKLVPDFSKHEDHEKVIDDVYSKVNRVVDVFNLDTMDKINKFFKYEWSKNYAVLTSIYSYINFTNKIDMDTFIRKMNHLVLKHFDPECATMLVIHTIENHSIMDYKINHYVKIKNIKFFIKLYTTFNIDIRDYYNIESFSDETIDMFNKYIDNIIMDDKSETENCVYNLFGVDNFIKLLNPNFDPSMVCHFMESITNITSNSFTVNCFFNMMNEGITIDRICHIIDMIRFSGVYYDYISDIIRKDSKYINEFFNNLISLAQKRPIDRMVIYTLCIEMEDKLMDS